MDLGNAKGDEMTAMNGPALPGATPDQIRCLQSPIAFAACSVHPFHKWVYVSGAVARMHLNNIFGFDGWSMEILSSTFIAPDMGNPVTKTVEKDKAGNPKDMYRATAQAKVRLHLHWPGGRTTFKDGIGTSGVPQPNAADACDMNSQSAVTYALRDAAINLGPQFGLEVMRLKLNDDRGRPIPWKEFTGDEPVWPDFLATGQRAPTDYRALNDQADVGDEPASEPATQKPTQRQSAETRRQPEQRQEPEPEPARPAARREPPIAAAERELREQKREDATAPITAHHADSSRLDAVPIDFDRAAYLLRCREAWGAVHKANKGRSHEIMAARCDAWGVEIRAENLKRDEGDGGPTDILLADITLAIEHEMSAMKAAA